jgi:hypothetical protein
VVPIENPALVAGPFAHDAFAVFEQDVSCRPCCRLQNPRS